MKELIYRTTKIFVIVSTLVLSITSKVSANGGCVPVYGGGVQCPPSPQIIINKTVKNPATGFFVDNLGPSDPKYRPQQVVTFHLTVKNPTDQTMNNISVSDKLPREVDFVSGPGNFDQNSRTLNFSVDSLSAGESRVFEITGRTVHPALLSKNVTCPVNAVDAKTSDKSDHDESQFCIQKEAVIPVVPKAGAETGLLLGLVSALTGGIILRKKS